MIVPFFITKIWEYTPKVSFSFLDIESPSKKQGEYSEFAIRQANRGIQTAYQSPNFRPGYIKTVHTQYPEWHSFDRPMIQRNMQYHKEVCARMYQVETLDGSEYYLCQHGVQVK